MISPGAPLEDPTEKLARAAEKLDTMVEQLQTNPIFYHSFSFGALLALWLQATLTIGLYFLDRRRRPMPFGGRGVLRLTRLPRHDRGPVPGGNR